MSITTKTESSGCVGGFILRAAKYDGVALFDVETNELLWTFADSEHFARWFLDLSLKSDEGGEES